MKPFRCFDVVIMILEEAIEQFEINRKSIAENLDILREYCEAIDTIAQDFDGEQYTVELEKETGNIIIAVDITLLCIEKKDHIIYQLINRSVNFRFSSTENARLQIQFTFPSLWKTKGEQTM